MPRQFPKKHASANYRGIKMARGLPWRQRDLQQHRRCKISPMVWGRHVLVGTLLLCSCQKEGAQVTGSYGTRFDLFYGADLNQRGVTVRWGGTQVSSNTGNSLVIETRFSDRATAAAAGIPLHVLVGDTEVFSETPAFSSCDVVADFGVPLDEIRLARFSRAIDVDGHTVLNVSRENGRPPLFCYTVPGIVSAGAPSTSQELEVLLQISLPPSPVTFEVDNQRVLPLAIGLDETDSLLKVTLRLTAPLASPRVGELIVSVDGAVSSPFQVSAERCQATLDSASNRLIQLSETVAWNDGAPSADLNALLTCCYQSGLCTGSIP